MELPMTVREQMDESLARSRRERMVRSCPCDRGIADARVLEAMRRLDLAQHHISRRF
jgi:hypothetical protein